MKVHNQVLLQFYSHVKVEGSNRSFISKWNLWTKFEEAIKMKVKIAIRFHHESSPNIRLIESRCLLGLCFANLHICGNISAATQPEGIEDGLTMGACIHLRHRLEVEPCSMS